MSDTQLWYNRVLDIFSVAPKNDESYIYVFLPVANQFWSVMIYAGPRDLRVAIVIPDAAGVVVAAAANNGDKFVAWPTVAQDLPREM